MFDKENSEYYNNLSESIKRQIQKSAKQFDTETELREYVSELME